MRQRKTRSQQIGLQEIFGYVGIIHLQHDNRVTKSKNFPDSKILVAKTFRVKRVNRVNFQMRINGGFARIWIIQLYFLDDLGTF